MLWLRLKRILDMVQQFSWVIKVYVDNAKWIFQVDADNEMSPKYFDLIWDNRDKYDFLIGIRDNRQQPFSRKLVSLIS